ncbi:MAG: hypothetical protein ABL879_17095, partial [Devosia sp.]
MSFSKGLAILVAAALLAPVAAALAADPFPAPLPSFRQNQIQLAPTDLMPEAAITPDVAADPGTGPVTRTVSTTSVSASEASAAMANPQPVTLTAQVTEGSGPIAEGLTWRVYDTRTDSSGQLALADESNDAVAQMSLKPGTYVVHVAYG